MLALPCKNVGGNFWGKFQKVEEQPFIETVRNKTTGTVEMHDVIPLFQNWVYGQIGMLPKFDIALLATYTNLEKDGGVAVHGGACLIDHVGKQYFGVLVMDGTLIHASHEIGHLWVKNDNIYLFFRQNFLHNFSYQPDMAMAYDYYFAN